MGSDFASYKKIIHDQILSSRVVSNATSRQHHFQVIEMRLKYYKINKKKYWVPSEVDG